MVVKGTIQSGPLMEHTSYSGGDKVARVTANHVTGWMVGITGQSLPTLEDSDFAWFDNACSLCHFPLPCTSPKQLDVSCDVVFFCAVLRG